MKRLQQSEHSKLLNPGSGPCISVYVRGGTPVEIAKDQEKQLIRLIKIRPWLRNRYLHLDVEALLRPLEHWIRECAPSHPNGVAVFHSEAVSGFMERPDIPISRVVIASSFHLRPVMSQLQQHDGYISVTVERKGVTVYSGSTAGARRIEHIAMPQHVVDFAPFLRSGRGTLAKEALANPERRPWGRMGRSAVVTFLKRADDRIRRIVKMKQLPLIIVGDQELLNLYRSATRIKDAEWVAVDPGSQLTSQMVEAVARQHSKKLEERSRYIAVRNYTGLLGTGLTTSSFVRIMELARRGMIKQLILRRGTHFWSRSTQSDIGAPVEWATGDDLLDDAAEEVLRSGGEVIDVDAAKLPDRAGALAIPRKTQPSELRGELRGHMT